MTKKVNQNFIKESGQEMYFNEKIAKEMIEREKKVYIFHSYNDKGDKKICVESLLFTQM